MSFPLVAILTAKIRNYKEHLHKHHKVSDGNRLQAQQGGLFFGQVLNCIKILDDASCHRPADLHHENFHV